MKPRVLAVDEHGVTVARGFEGALDVHFDGWRGWSVSVDEEAQEDLLVRWPKRLRKRLEGVSLVTVTSEGEELYRDELTFGSGEGRVELVDRFGTPIIIDKWGLQQRPFEARRAAGAVEAMTVMAERVLEVMRRRCGIEGWISFGTLLGAARSGQVIGHDSDIDLCFLSERQTPAEMVGELWGIARALTDEGISVKHKTGSFITVVYEAPDGGEDGIDIYTCFYLGDLLHETATVRASVPRDAILPLRELEFEGRSMPAPADPDRMLAVSYGPQWRVPDPSFRHLPPRSTTERFDGWFGSLMTHRRDWSMHNVQEAARGPAPSSFARWVTAQLDGTPRVHDVGSGSSADLVHYAGHGCKALGYDYAHPGRAATGDALVLPELAVRRSLNLRDLRDVLTAGAVAARQPGDRVVCARRLLEVLDDAGREAFWRFASMTLRSGGRAYVEGVGRSAAECRRRQQEHGEPGTRPLSPADLEPMVRRVGGRIVHREGFAAAARATQGGTPARWRMIVEWTPPSERDALGAASRAGGR